MSEHASEAWLSLITTCKGTALEIVQSTDSPSAAWRKLLQRYRACGLKEKSSLMRELNSLKKCFCNIPPQIVDCMKEKMKNIYHYKRPN